MRKRRQTAGTGVRKPATESGVDAAGASPDLSRVSETALAALYWRAVESQRPDALLNDDKAVALVRALGYNFESIARIPMPELLNVMRSMLAREMDRYAQDFLSRHPDAVVVHIGCGLDTRFERVDNGRVEWYDLDVPEVIDGRRELLGEGDERHHLLSGSVLGEAWIQAVKVHAQQPLLFLAETVLVYFTPEQVRSLVLTLRDHFPGAELVFDAWRPFEVWVGNRYLARSESVFAGLLRWGVWGGREVEKWGEGIRLLDEWGFFDRPEPRLVPFRWMAPIFRLFKPIRIFHFRLGAGAGLSDGPGGAMRGLAGVAGTLLITLYIRALESRRRDALVKDERAEAVVRQLDEESLRRTLALTDDFSRVAVVFKGREFDRLTADFLNRNPNAVVVHIGCGLDTRFERMDNGHVQWCELDLPEVIEARRRLIGGGGDRHHLLAGSVLEDAWLDVVSAHRGRPFLFVAEGVFMYFREAQVKALIRKLHARFSGAELVFDAFSPFLRWAHNVRVTRTGVGERLHWGLKNATDLEGWCPGVRLIDAHYPFRYPEPRMQNAVKMRLFPFLRSAVGVYRYRL